MQTVYFDTCSLQRLLDDKTQVRIALEAEAVTAVIALCEQGQLALVSSAVLDFEVARNPHPQRRAVVTGILTRHHQFLPLTAHVHTLARRFADDGFTPLDALHIATAQDAAVDYSCTCDDRFLRKARSHPAITITVVSPLELAQEVLQ
ncbi:MAG TPA: PIN domain-containing protein [Roseiflexaceae bacterium]|nr:PIN domain-containing protein [Roseiflexaceae bacterium]HMP43308.1 PIN domain-containing protein [Roseiflexaceae bacterium]